MAIWAEDIEVRGAVDIDRDRRLVLRHQTGDAAAFDELYRQYHGRLVAYCARRVGDRHVAEELAQEAFVRALRAMPRFAGERRFYPWMTVIAQRLCIDHHRKASRVEPTADVDTGAVEPDHDALWAEVDREHLAQAMDRLAPRHREILELREHRGWSYQQIADHLDVPMTTVEALLHRARKALRREFLAVAGDHRSTRLGAAVAAGGAATRLKGWLAAASPAKLAPVAGTAAAGTLALGVVAGPLAGLGDDGGTVRMPAPVATAAEVVEAPPATVDPVATGSPVVPAAAPIAAAVDPAAAAPIAAAPAPALDAGVAEVHVGEEAAAWAREENARQPLQVTVGDLVDVGLHPVQLVFDVLEPGTGGTP